MFANFDTAEIVGDPVPKDYTFTLVPGTTIGGHVHDEVGAPIQGAKVEVAVDALVADPARFGGTGQPVVDKWLAYGDACCITDEHGFWALSNFPAGSDWRIGLRLRHPEHVDDLKWRGMGGPPFPLQQFRDQTAVTVMENGVRVTGIITAPDGKPVPKALVIWGDKPYHNSNVQETFSDEAGHYKMPPLSPGKIPITIVAEGYAPVLKEIEFATATAVEDFQLEKGKTTTIRFVDDAGKPIPGVKVNIRGWRGRQTLFNWRHSNVPYSQIPDEADDKGVYTWNWAPEDPVDFTFSKKGYEWHGHAAFGPGPHEETLQEKPAP